LAIQSPPHSKKGESKANEGKRRTRAKDKEKGDVNEGPNYREKALYHAKKEGRK